ncbi:uncharacterized protein LOC107435029 isoform X3 [Ziziphus jujuba]|uniref:Uncharacterized protein LOC107435029 isoform X3 n=1 Tax=Ziziphus jujuba TaxID=326968 RepID=A0A6P6FN22_ZIZJJ|nr:uncharacterized protein LOC107435029 isoform X3 [Ziziphus jujuba]
MAVGRRNQVLLGLALVMILGIAVYLRLWTIDYTVSADDTELLRRQFDLANKEAMDESAEWRLKYDVEAERATKCLGELNKQIKESYKKDEHDGNINQKLAVLKKICGLWLVT